MILRYRSSIDIIGFSVSALCALHCFAVPLVVALTTFTGLAFLEDPFLEKIILTMSAVLGLLSLVPSYNRYHKHPKPLTYFAAGIVLIGLSRLEVHEVWEISMTSVGATLVASAHIINRRLCATRTASEGLRP
jgi:hypothetical protein